MRRYLLHTSLMVSLAAGACKKGGSTETSAGSDEPPPATETGATAAPGAGAKTDADSPGAGAIDTEPQAGVVAVTPTTFRADAVPELPELKGDITGGVAFRDADGDKLLVFARIDKEGPGGASRYLYAYHLVTADGATRVLRTVRDQVEDCEYDLVAEFLDDASGVTDLDGDGIGEVTFAYRLTCTSDVSPLGLKLLVLEGEDKYIIRGTTRVPPMGEGDKGIPSSKQLDDSLKSGPPAFREHAEAVWEKVADSGF